MTTEWTGPLIIDEIDRLVVTYGKAKEYLSKITSGIEQQITMWQHRRQLMDDQISQMKPSSSYEFLLPKTQRINELTLEAVQALCRVDLLMEQVLRIDLKSQAMPVLSGLVSSDFNPRESTTSGKVNGSLVAPIPVLRTPVPVSSGRSSTITTMTEKSGFEPVRSQANSSRSSSIFPQNQNSITDNFHSTRSSIIMRTPQSHNPSTTSQATASYPPRPQIRPKETIKLQRIPPGTVWRHAKIDIIDSLSGFYVINLDPQVYDKFLQMLDELHEYYTDLEKSNQLTPLENVWIGDFGVAKYSEDNRWYRARAIMQEGQDQIRIVFVDFGNIEVKSIKEFFPLHRPFTDLPAQAIGCSLSEAYPRADTENGRRWSDKTIQMFKLEVCDKVVEIHFANEDEGTKQWPLHFVRVIRGDKSVTSIVHLQKRMDLRSNQYIAEQMINDFSQQEYILFNVPIGDDGAE